MKDIDRAISQALASEAESFAPADLGAAEQRFVRRRRRRRFTWFGGATLATAAALIAVAVFPRPNLADQERQRPAGTVMTRVSVGEAPVSVTSTSTAVWVANSGEGTVSRIDPDTGEVVATIDVGGSPEEVAADQFGVWVYDAASRNVLKIDWSSNAVIDQYTNEWPEGTHLDLALKDLTLWMADPETRAVNYLYKAGPAPESQDYVGPRDLDSSGAMPERGGDVALESESGEIWSYNGQAGTLTLLQGANGTIEPAERPDVTGVLTSENGDLAVGGEALWVSDDFGVIMRIDRKTFETQHIDLGGAWSDLSYGGGYLWALTAEEGDDGTATLRRIDPTTAEVVGEPLLLEDGPVDVSADRDAVWVAHKDASAVTRIDVTSREAEPDPGPSTEEQVLDEPLGPDDLVMVFSGVERRGGMTFAMYGDGRTELLTSPIEADLYPSFVRPLYSENPAILIERRDLKTLDSDLKYVDIVTGDEIDLVPGSLPAVSPQGQVAYWRMEKENPTLFITEIGTDFSREILLDAAPRAIEWDAGGRFVYVELSDGHEDVRIVSYDSTGDLHPVQPDSGANARFFAPSSREPDSVHFIRIESFEEDFAGPFDTIKLVESTDATDPTETIDVADLTDLPIDENAFLPENLRLTATGRLDANVGEDGSISWGIGDERSWIVGFRTQAWLVKQSGEIVDLGEIANGGIAVAPELLDR